MARHTRLGIWFFGIYVLLYSSFVLVNAFAPHLMERTPWLGVNLAIWSGFGLILAAVAMSLVYGILCGILYRTSSPNDGTEGKPRR